MLKVTLSLVHVFLLLFGLTEKVAAPAKLGSSQMQADLLSPAAAQQENGDIKVTRFAGPDLTPSPSCLAVAASGEVFVGVDMQGSLGKAGGKGKIVRLVDSNNDGKADKHTTFAMVDNPRGILPIGDKVYVLHTRFSPATGKAHGMDLVVFSDKDQDGVADGPYEPLIQGISTGKILESRGADHATNGIRMGIDGWIYIAVGDFGIENAVGRDGNKLTMLGGGIVRVRPDGTEMEMFTHGMRNIYDVAIDPYMNIFTRGNNNDGGGWNIRFSHHIQSGEYGYPSLFKHFTDEIIPGLVDLGGGSGTGALFLDDATWPAKYNKTPLMADWGRSQLYLHPVTPDGGSFKQQEVPFLKLPQITDLDIDASGRMYLSAWDGAGYSGSAAKGYVVRAVPENWKYKPFPNLKTASVKDLANLLKAESAVARLHAQQELLSRPGKAAASEAQKIAADKNLPLYARVAGLYTYAQAAGEGAVQTLVKLAQEPAMREFALRALSDRKPYLKDVPTAPFLQGLNDPSERVKITAIIGLGRLGRQEAVPALLQVKVPSSFAAPAFGTVGPHAVPNPVIIPAHLAVKALVNLHAVDASLAAVGKENAALALWALRYLHDPKAVKGLITAYNQTRDDNLKKEILTTLSRLYHKEAPYDGSWWWGTRPDTHGPYYKGITWESSPAIANFLKEEWRKANAAGKEYFTELNTRHQMGIPEFAEEEVVVAKAEVDVDLEKIKNQKGQVGKTSIEDVMVAMAKLKGNAIEGKAIFARQGCGVCHSIAKDEPMKGPYMGQVGSIMNREQITEAILKPNASISQGFASVFISAKGDKNYMGFITEESASKVVLRNVTGQVYTVNTGDILTREVLETSMMPAGLANALSFEELASLVTFLEQQK